MATFSAADLRPMRLMAGGMLGGGIFFLAVATALRISGGMGGSVEILTWLACGFALVSPVTGSFLGAQALRNPSPQPGIDPRRTAFLVQCAQMEASVLFCGVALLAGPHIWPLVAALVPLTVMVMEFPRADVPRTG